MSYTLNVGGKIIETTAGKDITYAKENIVFNSTKTITFTGVENGVIFGKPEEYKMTHPEIVEVQFLDEKNTVLKQSSLKNFGGIKATDILYGKKVKLKIITKEVKEGTKISFNLKGETKSVHQDFFGLDKLKWDFEIKANSCETDFFEINPLWYSEDFESYNYDSHKTEIKPENLNNFYVKGVLNAKPFELPEKENRLMPIAYLRNYEELIGLFNTDDSGIKDLVNNYENKFISTNSEILEIAREFSEFINNTKELTTQQIKTRVEQDAKCIWDSSVKQVQSGKLDDRPLYWTRNKMQVRLKRHFLFEKDIDFEKSIVKKGTELEKIIQLFEEKSRNYNGIDFNNSAGAGCKKILITGFDPFLLNKFDHPDKDSYNILQSNPSGVVALALANNDNLGAFIQTMVVPVRYTDFDGSQDNSKGQGEGIIEKYIKPFIKQVDMIITVSQSGPDNFNIDVFGTSRRGGSDENMNFIRETNSKAINTNIEWIKTTLPSNFTKARKVKLEWKYNFTEDGETKPPKTNQIIEYGSGGSYLSNEIFFRVGKIRTELNPRLPTGHFHISKIQLVGEDLDYSEINEVLEIVKNGIIEGIK